MLIDQTVLMSPDSSGFNAYSKLGLAEYTQLLLRDGYDAIVASVVNQHSSYEELKKSAELTVQQYADFHIEEWQVDDHIAKYPQWTGDREGARMDMAIMQLSIIRKMMEMGGPRVVVDRGSVTSKLVFSLSDTETVEQNDQILPKPLVRPPNAKSAASGGNYIGEITLEFRVEQSDLDK